MKKKVLCLIVAIVMVLTMLPVMGLATDTPPAVEITSVDYADGAVSLEWQGQDGVDGYRVYRKTGTGKWTSILSSTTETSYTDNTVTEGKTYSYTVRSYVGKTWSAGYNDTAVTITAKAAVEPQPITITSIDCASGAVSLAWQGQNGVDGYRVYRKTGTGKWTSILSSTTDTSYTDNTVTEGKTYSYTVRSYVGSAWSTGYNDTAVTITVKAAVEPAPVTITSIGYTNGTVSLAWQGQDGVDGYRVYRKTGTGKWTSILSSTTDTSYSDATVTEGKKYSYTVRSYVGSAWSTGYNDTAATITAKTVEPLPVTITSIDGENGEVGLAWQAQDGVDGYRVYRKTGTGKWTTVLSSTTETSYTDTAVTAGTTYTYTVRSFVGSTYSTGYADTAKSVKVSPAAPPAAVNINMITQSSTGGIKIAWDARDNVDGCRVYRKSGSGSWKTVLAHTTDTTFTDPDVTPGVTYYYTVRAVKNGVWSTGYADTAKSFRAGTPTLTFNNGEVTGISNKRITNLVIPRSIDGIEVTDIGRNAFNYCTGLESVTIPSTVTRMAYGAFQSCNALASVNISDIEAWCNISFVTFDANPLYFAHHLYLNGKEVTRLVIPEGVTSIGVRAFQNCDGLTSVTIPSSMTSIGNNAFYNCSALTSINVDADNTAYTSVDGVLFTKDKKTLVMYPAGKSGAYTVPSGVTSIRDNAFACCRGLTSVIIPEGVARVGSSAFENCSGLTSVSIPSSVTNIEGTPFYKCEALKSINAAPENTAYTSVDGVLFTKDMKTLIAYPTGKSGEYTVPSGVTGISAYAFAYCSGLTSVTIPSGVTDIDRYTFAYCSSLESVMIPEGVTSIGGYAFEYCSRLTSVTIPVSVTSIGSYAFDGCDRLRDVYYNGNDKEWRSISIGSGNYALSFAELHCSGEYDPGFKFEDGTISGVEDYGVMNLVIPESINGEKVKSIGAQAFVFCENLASVTIAQGVEEIGDEAFSNCDRLTSVTIPSSVKVIGSRAFAYCWSLDSITIPQGVEKIGDEAFAYCWSLISINIPSSVTSIGQDAFLGCYLISINVDAGNTEYESADDVLFTKDKNVLLLYPCAKEAASYDIPSGVTVIGRNAFYNSLILTSVTIPPTVTSIETGAFGGSGVTTLTIPLSVTFIAYNALGEHSSSYYGHNTKLTDVYYSGSEEQWKSIYYGTSGDMPFTLHCADTGDQG
ncbi:MAG: leucine-rich repeat protein [Clostridia bacterium]|nr:leucine-rich repeat protein [Clostridia bacterium]